MNLFLIFLIGLTTGGLSCAAMQGGLLTGLIANQKERKLDDSNWQPVLMFLSSKLVVHTLFGFLLGLAGSVLEVSLEVRLFFQFLAAIFMFGTAMNLMDVHPIFRHFAFQPPKFLQRMVRNSAKSQALFGPALLGVLTIFIPCGTTQAMELLAINSGDPIQGALIMFAFVLGTSPLFAAIGVATAKLAEGWRDAFLRFAAFVLVIMAAYSVNGILVVFDSPITAQKIARPLTYFFSDERFENVGGAGRPVVVDGVQKLTINVFNNGYSPRNLRAQAGIPVELMIKTNDVYSCATSFTMKAFNIRAFLNPTDEQTFTFTPSEPGNYTFTCSMGMYTGTLEVI